jgi:NAD dependent epimerase/dehydratase family enzyme
MLRLALGEMSSMLLTGQRVVPARALAAGFVFAHPTLGEALQSLLT